MKLITESWRKFLAEGKDLLRRAGMKACNFMNCKIFVQEITKVAKVRDLPSKQSENEAMFLPGEILVWSNSFTTLYGWEMAK